MIGVEKDFDAFRDDFAFYLANRLGVSRDVALSYLGDWLVAFNADAHATGLARSETRAEAGTTTSSSSEESDPGASAIDGAETNQE